ncbi:MFS transporter [Komagataeibacter rhaeticus]|nr:MFS transporter [Komagataeibacter rhaeticus]
MILGVPMGTVVAQMTSWRMAFWLICAVGVLAWSTMWLWIPQDRASGPAIPLSAQFRAMLHPLVITMMLVSMCTSSSMFTLFTYITPFLQTRSGFGTHAIDGILLMIGGGLCLGNLLGAGWRTGRCCHHAPGLWQRWPWCRYCLCPAACTRGPALCCCSCGGVHLCPHGPIADLCGCLRGGGAQYRRRHEPEFLQFR